MTTPVCGIGGGDRDPVATASPRGRVRHRPDRALGVRFVALRRGEAALDGFRAAAIDGIDRDEAKAHEAVLVDLVAQLRGANALDAIGLKRPVTAKYLRVLYGAAQAAIDELPGAAA